VTEPVASSAFAWALLHAFVRQGVRHLVLAPGSRSQALALAAGELERQGRVALHVCIDERSAGFLALGIARESGMPAPVIVTSGGAVANLHPAVAEAAAAFVPLVLLTADRPPELHGVRANQTMDQAGLFGASLRHAVDVPPPEASGQLPAAAAFAAQAEELAASALDAALGSASADPGPVQLNLGFREPLSGGRPWEADAVAGAAGASSPAPTPLAGAPLTRGASALCPAVAARAASFGLGGSARTVVIAGADAGPAAEALAHAGSWPLLAEVASGARYGRELVVHYRELLRDPALGGRVERAVVFGHPTLSREVPALLQRQGVESIVVAPQGAEAYDPGRGARVVRSVALVDPSPDRSWLGEWVVADRQLRQAADDERAPDLQAVNARSFRDLNAHARAELAVMREPVDRRMLALAVWRASWPQDRLVLAASRLIREFDAVVPGKKIPVHASRGLAGIDGTIATALGIAAASQAEQRPGAVRVVLGDLALLHDAGSLLLDPAEPRPRILLVVGNDGGGTIFDSLEVAATADSGVFERVVLTPRSVELEALAHAYGWSYLRAANRGELEAALTAPVTGPTLLEVPLPR